MILINKVLNFIYKLPKKDHLTNSFIVFMKTFFVIYLFWVDDFHFHIFIIKKTIKKLEFWNFFTHKSWKIFIFAISDEGEGFSIFLLIYLDH